MNLIKDKIEKNDGMLYNAWVGELKYV